MESDAELVIAAREGNREAFGRLLRRYEGAVRATALQVLGDYHAADDAAQEAFLIAYRKLGQLRKASAFGGWVVKTARREALRHARRGSKALSLDGLDPPAPPSEARLDEPSQHVLSAVMKLAEGERLVVMLRYFDGHAVKDIATITGRSVGTVTKQLSRAHGRLRDRLEGWNHD